MNYGNLKIIRKHVRVIWLKLGDKKFDKTENRWTMTNEASFGVFSDGIIEEFLGEEQLGNFAFEDVRRRR